MVRELEDALNALLRVADALERIAGELERRRTDYVLESAADKWAEDARLSGVPPDYSGGRP